MSPSDSFLAKKTYTWVLSIGGEVVGKIQNKTIYPWDQPGFIKHGVSPSELMFQIEADELYDHYKNYHDVYYLLAKKYPDSSIAQARINYYANQATLAKFVGPPDKPSAKIPGATYMWNEPSVVQTPADKSYMNPKPQYYEAYVIKGTKNKIYWSYDSSRTWNGTGFDSSIMNAIHYPTIEAAHSAAKTYQIVLYKVFKLSIPILLEEVKEESEVITDDDVLI